jgi:hypothetical protein
MSGIPIEQPPFSDNEPLQEWLTRQMILISSELERSEDLQPINVLPAKIQDGMVRFFRIPILPEITAKGPWVVIDGAWVPMTGVI